MMLVMIVMLIFIMMIIVMMTISSHQLASSSLACHITSTSSLCTKTSKKNVMWERREDVGIACFADIAQIEHTDIAAS